MSRLTRALTASVAAVAGVAAFATPAQAAPTMFCREVTVGFNSVASVCVGFDAGLSGTTVSPTIYWGCTIGDNAQCTGEPIGVGTTGFVPNVLYPAPDVDVKTLSIRVHPGTIGTLWVAGQDVQVVTAGFCVGDPSFCP